MDYDSDLYLLSAKFTQDYPAKIYPELMHKQGRPYTCLLIDTHDNFFICVPFRSCIQHKNSFLFHDTVRSRQTSSGLDYSKIAIIRNPDYLDSSTHAIVDQDEYNEMKRNLSVIVQEVNDYVDTYINHIKGITVLHPKQYARRYQYATLPYFHDIMEITGKKYN